MDLRITAKPGELTFCIAASGLLDRGFGFFEFHFAVEHRAQFAVADEIEGLGVRRQTAGHQPTHLFHPTSGEHCIGSRMNALI